MGKVLAWTGGLGAGVGLLCCFTPILPILLTGLGLSALIDVLYRDAVLLPFAAISLIVMLIGLRLIRADRASR